MENSNQLEKALAVLTANKDRVPASLVTAFQAGKIKVLSNVIILRKEVSVGNTQQLVDADTKKIAGVSDFEGNTLSDNRALIVGGMRIGYSANAAAGKEAELDYLTALPIAYRNSRLRITQGGIIFDYPLSALSNPHTGRNLNDDIVRLPQSFVFVPGQEFSMELIAPKNAAIAGTDKHYLEFSFYAEETRLSNS